MTEAFMIENSWLLAHDYEEGHANLKLYATEDDAKQGLSDMAFNFGITLSYEDTSFESGEDVYYINRYEIEGI